MANLVDRIEQHLKLLLAESPQGMIELQRNDLAAVFGCVPSQITYVLGTRFTAYQGYLVESRRGGGGFIRVTRLSWRAVPELEDFLRRRIGDAVSQSAAESLVQHLAEEGLLTDREARLLRRILHRDTLRLDDSQRKRLRAGIIQAVLLALLEQPART